MKIYRVIRKTTGSLQPRGTFWKRSLLYIGPDRQEARLAYHEANADGGVFRGHGQRCEETIVETIDDAESDDFEDDVVEQVTL